MYYSFVLLYNYKKKSKNKGHERYVRIVQTTYDRLQDLKKKAKSWPFGMSSSGCVQILREPSIVPVNNISQCHCQDLLSILFTQKSLSNHRILFKHFMYLYEYLVEKL